MDEPPEPAALTRVVSGMNEQSAETWRLFRLLARASRLYGRESLGPVVVSMTRGAADVLAVLLLARWAGGVPGLMVVPLFETLADLDAAPRIMAELFALPVYAGNVRACAGEQMVMIGYSDSNKDSGYLAANWALYRAQESIAQVCDAHGVALTLFHGRGGSVARGGGPAGRAIRAQPPSTVRGRFRVTEQGETIASRYADRDLAHRHLEQIVSAVLLASAETRGGDVPADWRIAMDAIGGAAREGVPRTGRAHAGISSSTGARPRPSRRSAGSGSARGRRRAGGARSRAPMSGPSPGCSPGCRVASTCRAGTGSGSGLRAADPARLRVMYAGWPFFRACSTTRRCRCSRRILASPRSTPTSSPTGVWPPPSSLPWKGVRADA